MNVAIIGGGYAGLAAAVALAEHSVPVTVFEAAPQLGGRSRGVEINGAALDNGQHILIGAYRETLRMIALVNRDAGNVLLHLPLDWRIHNRFHMRAAALPAPLHLALGLLAARGASLAERWAAAAFMRAMRSIRFHLTSDITVNELLRQHRQGQAMTRYLWHPMCIAALNTPPDIASAQVFLNVLRDGLDARRADSEVMLAKVDLSSLFPDPAAAYIRSHDGQVLTGHGADSIFRNGDGYAVRSRDQVREFTHVVCAVPPYRLSATIAGLPELGDSAALVERFQYQPIYTVYLQYPERVPLPSTMLGMDGGLAQWIFDREATSGQQGLVAAVISAEGPHQDMAQGDIARRIHAELCQNFGALPAPVWQRVIAEKRATYACTVGLQRPAQRTPLKNFFLAGDYTESEYPATLEAAVRSGVKCAHLLLESR